MVMCSAMDSVVIPRPPALPLGPLVPTFPLKGTSLPPPPPPPKPQHNQLVQTEEKESSSVHVTRNQEVGDKKVCEERTVFEERRIIQKMVDKKITRNESTRSKISSRSVTSQKSNGFRLRENGHNNSPNNMNNDDAGSIYSIYKQKIDSMFESDSSTSHNSVQAKIEKMFSDVAKDSGLLPTQIGVHTFSVDYLGSIPLQDKVNSLSGLQKPLRKLYFSYKKLVKNKKTLSGRLEISPQGLKVQYQGQSGDLEQMNSYPSIAVWSAVKFVIQETTGNCLSYAFLPLITDPDNMDKQALFKNLEDNEKKYITKEEHSPLFAVVMRKIGVQKQLECHGFVCQTSEDAIVIAATLYKSLVHHMKHKEKRFENKNGVTTCMSTTSSTIVDKTGASVPVRPPRRKRSSATSSVCSDTNSIANVSDTQPLLSSDLPSAPKKSTKAKRAPEVPNQFKQEDLDAIVPYEEPIDVKSAEVSEIKPSNEDEQGVQEIKPKSFSDKLSTFMSKEQKQIAEELKQMVTDSNKGLKRVQSFRKQNDDTIRKKEHSGDIFTKVTIPRSGSFLNTAGLTRNNETASGGSPLGFKEIFNELSLQEGLHSMDDILSVIIDPDGMSFNDLKPIYKEFLLKLALTLTKDELYMKSKSIMRRQKKKQIKRSASVKKASHTLISGKFKRLKHIFQKSFREKQNKKLMENSKLKNIVSSGCGESKLPESSISTSSYDTRQFRTKEELAGKKSAYRKKSHGDYSKNRRRDRASTSEESDFMSLKRQNKYKNQNSNLLTLNHNRNSSSGYVSCSECSYDSDTCTCVSADKCYCSLGQRNIGNGRRGSLQEEITCAADPTLIYCDCDTDSCAESNKCYCHYGNRPIIQNNRNTSHHHSNCMVKHSQKHKKLCKKNSNTKSSRSLEYMSNPSEGYYEKLKSKQKFGSERIISHYASKNDLKKRRNSHSGIGGHIIDGEFSMITHQNVQMGMVGGNLTALNYDVLKMSKRDIEEALYRGAFSESFKDYCRGNSGIDPRGQRIQSAITTGACTEALSVKKSAEIAALFADMKLTQTTDITHLAPQGFDMNNMTESKNLYNSEQSLLAKYSKPIKGPPRPDSKAISLPKPPLPPPAYARPTGLTKNKSKLYSAKNGLYTIQSQSDESRASSVSGEGRRKRENSMAYSHRRNVSSNIENSLGYLP
ncbi:uncharacterized protein LOC115881683 isoform X2 [Sitophilus oryzae]|uniref:Uncharacterized protein LOC115881683 isoform X2 n=1 Tax=Sitophilus oryzae TaxID=7048 RepID=A0A6J2XWX9_SITOR|nr:uncharacterized protein LOC115881683 isoform X2 [Sitophilus oryzae]